MIEFLPSRAISTAAFPRAYACSTSEFEIDIHAQEILKVRDNLNSILKEHTGQSMKNIQKDTDRDNFMSASESAKYGLIDKVINKR